MAMALTSSRLYLKDRRGRALCSGMYVQAESGNITGIMGPAGAGKSVFLKLLCGQMRPSRGTVQINGHDLHANHDMLREKIGYVPQAEIMIPELTVAASLDYRLRLHTNLSREVRQQKIRSVCSNLGFEDDTLEKIVGQQIGSPESKGDHPSGGGRRRINIAHELISDPEILFLDEPTSGLANMDAEIVVNLLRTLADKQDLNIILTIHQPSRDIFRQLDDLVIICWGGQIAYYGRAARAVEYFEQAFNLRMTAGRNPAEYVMDFVRDKAIGARAVEHFKEASGRPDALYLKRAIPEVR